MTAEPIARVKNVSHRYGATVSLADVSIDIPSRIMVGVIGPDGVGESTLLGLIAGVKKFSRAKSSSSTRASPTRRPCARFVAASPICRRALAATFTQHSPAAGAG